MNKLIAIFLLASLNPAQASSNGDAVEKPEGFHLKIDNISLHQSHAPCKPHEITYDSAAANTQARILLECSIDSGSDSIRFTFSSDRKDIVRIVRNQYLKTGDPEPVDVIRAAVKFYGKPNQIDEANLLANFGNAYSIAYANRFAIISRNAAGMGLLIKSYPCGDGSFGTEDCKGKGTRFVRYDLIDAAALNKAEKDGENKSIRRIQDKLKMQKF